VPDGPFNQFFFAPEGVVFTEGSFVSLVQGQNALSDPVAGTVRHDFASVSAQIAPAFQGTATYTLTAYRRGEQLARTSLTVTEDTGDPANRGFGYFTISIGRLRGKADSFSLSNVFVRSSFPPPTTTDLPFGVATIMFSH
jgi:hypothetical protein